MNKRKRILPVVFLLLAALLLTGCKAGKGNR